MNAAIAARLDALRAAMRAHGVAAVILPTGDPHASEYLPAHWQARAWFSGFDGSAGTLVVSGDSACLWTDSRYRTQAERQLADSGIALMPSAGADDGGCDAWLCAHVARGGTVAVAGDSMSCAAAADLHAELAAHGVALRTDLDLPGLAWSGRPPLPDAAVRAHAPPYVDMPRADKLGRLRQAMAGYGAEIHLLSSLDDIAWLLNLRGADVECNPVFLAHLLVRVGGGATLFIAPSKVDPSIADALAADGIGLSAYADVGPALGALADGTSLLLDRARVAAAIARAIPPGVRCIDAPNPSTRFKAVKPAAALAHIRAVMRCDGVALVRAFRRVGERVAAGVPCTELDVAALLHAERSRQPDWVGESFPTIAGYGANAALPHYRATAAAHASLHPRGMLLVDSGGQYQGGTTDVTRMLALGPTTREERRDSTQVLKGLIALSRASFPRGTNGPQLDALARAPLWACGMDYGHGTGHGVGYFLNVHEGPHGIRPPRQGLRFVALEPGMITSIEPGVYKPGRHGIRHENLAAVVPAAQTAFGEFLKFETLTLCPFDQRTLEPSLLGPEERAWLDDYHALVRMALAPLLDGADLAWLERHCAPLAAAG